MRGEHHFDLRGVIVTLHNHTLRGGVLVLPRYHALTRYLRGGSLQNTCVERGSIKEFFKHFVQILKQMTIFFFFEIYFTIIIFRIVRYSYSNIRNISIKNQDWNGMFKYEHNRINHYIIMN